MSPRSAEKKVTKKATKRQSVPSKEVTKQPSISSIASHATLLVVNPRLLFLYWAADATLKKELSHPYTSAELRIEVSDQKGDFSEVAREAFDFQAANWYLPNAYVDALVRIRLGIWREKSFVELLLTNPVQVPREQVGSDPEAWDTLKNLRKRGPRPHLLRPQHVSGEPPAVHSAVPATSPFKPIWHHRRPHRSALTPSVNATAAELSPATEELRFPGAGYLSFVLHTHLPFVRHPEQNDFLEEHWLFEAMTETYLPILSMLERLRKDRISAQVTLSLSPTLLTMLSDPLLMGKYERHMDGMLKLADREVERTRTDSRFGPLARFYRTRLSSLRDRFLNDYQMDLIAAFRRLEKSGQVELITCAGTHGFLPFLSVNPEVVWAQISTAVEEHTRHFGHPPKGIWLPECAYVEGLDPLVRRAGLDYFFVDAHAVKNASSRPHYGIHAPVFCPSGVAAFPRDEESSLQVWSSEMGYPGDPSYREFYRDIGYDLDAEYLAPYLDPSGTRGMTGFKYHRITGRTQQKEPYRREWAMRTAESHADDFLLNRSRQVRYLAGNMDRTPLVVAMYDAELFGHWWYEGPEWLETVLRRLPEYGLNGITPSKYLQAYPVGQVAQPAGSSWGERGYFEVWLNQSNDWIYPRLHDAAAKMMALAKRFTRASTLQKRALQQVGRELLLAQASDWPFILHAKTSTGYALRRIHDHLHRFDRLARQLEEGNVDETYLATVEQQDNIFPNLNPQSWRAL